MATVSHAKETSKQVIRDEIVSLLSQYKLQEADSLFKQYGAFYDFEITKYEKYKANYLKKYFQDSYYLKFPYDDEQLEAIASIHKNTLVTARAGSGKTQVIAGKTAYLLDNENLDASDILLLSFNKKAANEIKSRIRNFGDIAKKHNKKLLGFDNAMTFHSLAYKILGNKAKEYELLTDSMKRLNTITGIEEDVKTNKQLKFIQNCFYDIYEGNVVELMQNELASELSYFKHSGYLEDDNKYYEYRKKKEYFSFSGDFVRSKGEKIIMDLLFEYGFELKYEPYINIDGNYLSKPDIKCNIIKDGKKLLSRDIIIEHWGFDDKEDIFKKLPIGKIISGEKYIEIREKKTKYWTEQEEEGNYYFVQTSSKELYDPEFNPETQLFAFFVCRRY